MRWIAALLLIGPALTGCIGSDDGALESSSAQPGGYGQDLAVLVDPNEEVLPLATGNHAFWTIPRVEGSSGPPQLTPRPEDPREECAPSGEATCFEYEIDVAPSEGDRLRVALDHDDLSNGYRLGLYQPDGTLVDQGRDAWSIELFADQPAPGTWTVVVVAEEGTEDQARMRAKLEPGSPGPAEQADPGSSGDGAEPLLPNLRPVIPLDLHFELVRFNLGPAGTVPAGSCHADEMIEDGARRCLRFAFGYGNIGDGPFEVLFTPIEDGMTEGPVQQRVHLSDGSTELQPGGTYEYHATHGHYHYDDILTADLYRVLDPETGELETVIEAAKRGACAHDWRIAHWDAFIAAPRFSNDSGDDCGVLPGQTSPTDARIGLSRGWTDLYGSLLPDQYVEASDVDDGRYVLQVTIDAAGSVAETNETDNTGYTYFQVQGEEIEVLERGLGTDPWDAGKLVTEEWVP